ANPPTDRRAPEARHPEGFCVLGSSTAGVRSGPGRFIVAAPGADTSPVTWWSGISPRRRLFLAIAVAGIAVTAFISSLAFRADAGRTDARDDAARAQVVGALRVLGEGIQNRVDDAANLFNASDAVDLDEFRVFTEPMVGSSGLNGMSWFVHVAPHQR